MRSRGLALRGINAPARLCSLSICRPVNHADRLDAADGIRSVGGVRHRRRRAAAGARLSLVPSSIADAICRTPGSAPISLATPGTGHSCERADALPGEDAFGWSAEWRLLGATLRRRPRMRSHLHTNTAGDRRHADLQTLDTLSRSLVRVRARLERAPVGSLSATHFVQIWRSRPTDSPKPGRRRRITDAAAQHPVSGIARDRHCIADQRRSARSNARRVHCMRAKTRRIPSVLRWRWIVMRRRCAHRNDADRCAQDGRDGA